MDRLIYTAMTGAKNAFLQQAGIANNLANVSTTGFKSMVHKFRAVPIQGEGAPTRAFVVDASVANDFSQGPLMATGRSLDIAVKGAGWIAVRAPDGTEAYTRAGNLHLSGEGVLQTAAGMNVLAESGEAITIPPDNTITIAPDGTVSAVPLFGNPNSVNIVDRIKLVNPPESDLVRGDDTFFRVRGGGEIEPDHAIRLAPEMLEGSNVNPAEAMVAMISVARQFEMQIKMLQMADANAARATQILTIT